MRQYRGRIKDSTVWVYGYYTKSPQGIARIWSPNTKDNGESYLYDYVVDPETVGQYTGLKDKNGKEIYEGDIIQTQTMHYNGSGQFIGMTDRIASVVFHNGRFALRMESGAMPDLSFGLSFHEIIGNIYDNPELLKGDENA